MTDEHGPVLPVAIVASVSAPNEREWHLQRGIPIAIISAMFMMVVAAGGWIWILAQQAGAVTDTARRVTSLEQKMEGVGQDQRDVIARLGRIEGKLEIMLSKVAGR
jgi:hypothetical protein